MLLQDIVETLGLTPITPGIALARPVTAGYAADLLSCVMARAAEGTLWFTLQAHPNVVAVATLLNLAGVVITEGVAVPPETIARALQEGIPLLSTPLATYTVAGRVAALGVPGVEEVAGA